MLNTGQHLTIAIIWFKHIYSYYHLHSNIHIYSLQYNHDGIQKKVKRLIAIIHQSDVRIRRLLTYKSQMLLIANDKLSFNDV